MNYHRCVYIILEVTMSQKPDKGFVKQINKNEKSKFKPMKT